MFNRSFKDFLDIYQSGQLAFFDRGLPDVVGYMLLSGLAVSEEIWQAVIQHQYHKVVFMTPPWREIYINDSERKQSFEEAISTYDAMDEVYRSLGYRVVQIPRVGVAERVRFIFSILDL